MLRNRPQITICLLLALALSLGAGYNNGPGNGGNGGNGRRPPPAAPPATRPANTPLAQDVAAQTAAQTQLDQANKAMSDFLATVRPDFEQTPEWKAAQQQLQQAQNDLAAAKDSLATRLANDSDYQAALADKTKAQADLKAARESGDATPETLTPLANAILAANTKLARIAKDAQDSDTSVHDAQAKVDAAQHAVDQLNAKFLSTLEGNSQYTTAKSAVDDATKKFQAAHAKVIADGGS
jgi:chromosome segregation ATPase